MSSNLANTFIMWKKLQDIEGHIKFSKELLTHNSFSQNSKFTRLTSCKHLIIEYNLPEAFCRSSWLAVNSILANGTFIVFSLVAVEPERYSVDTKIKK